MQRTAWLAIVALLALLPAGAHPEQDAGQMHPDVVAVGHEPEVPRPGQQWTGHLRLRDGHAIERVQYQICEVGKNCFAPPTQAQATADGFAFDTTGYVGSEGPIRWGIGDGSDWHVGYKFILHHANGTVETFPHGIAYGSAACDALGPFDCDATNYFVFTLPGAVDDAASAAPSASTGLLVVLALGAAWASLRRR